MASSVPLQFPYVLDRNRFIRVNVSPVTPFLLSYGKNIVDMHNFSVSVTKNLPTSPRFRSYGFLSRCKFSTLTTRRPMVEFYLLTFPRFPLRKKEHKPYFDKNRTHDFRTSRCAGYLLDHSGDESMYVDRGSSRSDVLPGEPGRGRPPSRA